ncbi:hypothetical protein D0N50_20350 [Erwinia billingiae]|nr:hypothetical protein D0N50_20350 [Erwinia billingiae]
MFAALLILSGCAGRPDYTLSPPPSTEWFTIAVKLPAQMEVGPMDVLYRSEKCQRKDYDSTVESHIRQERGYNPQVVRMNLEQGGNLWRKRIAIDGGGGCDWKLSTVRVDIKLSGNLPITQGKNITSASYVFGFDDEIYAGGGLPGKRKDAPADLHIKTKFFPVVYVNRLFNKVDVDIFAGNTDSLKWSRNFRVNSEREAFIEPELNLDKVVSMESPISPSGKVTVIYPDGTTMKIKGVYPDYEKLLSIK